MDPCHVPTCPDPAEQYGFCERHVAAMTPATRGRLIASLYSESEFHNRTAALAKAIQEAAAADSPQLGLFGEGS